jgi:hypothetical protein
MEHRLADGHDNQLSKRSTAALNHPFPMPRSLQSADAIRTEVSRLIHEHRDLRASGAVIDVPYPKLLRTDGTGLNWWMSGFDKAFGFQEVIASAVTTVGKRWSLRED